MPKYVSVINYLNFSNFLKFGEVKHKDISKKLKIYLYTNLPKTHNQYTFKNRNFTITSHIITSNLCKNIQGV